MYNRWKKGHPMLLDRSGIVNGFRKLSLIRQILYLSLLMLIILIISYVISNMFAKRIIEQKVTESVSIFR